MEKSLIQILIENKVITNADVEKYYNENIRQQAGETSNKKNYSEIKNGVLVKLDTRDLNTKGEYVTPPEVVKIGRYAFSDCKNLVKVTLGKNVQAISGYAFYGSNVFVVEMTDNVYHIGEAAFAYCWNLSNIKLSDNIKTIQPHTFYQCSNLWEISLPRNLKRIKDSAFCSCTKLQHVDVNKYLTEIGKDALAGCPLKQQALKQIAHNQYLEQLKGNTK